MPRHSRAVASPDVRHAEGKIDRRLARLEQILEEVPQVCWWSSVAQRRPPPRREVQEETGNIVWRDSGQISDLIAEPELQEAISKAPAVPDRALAQSALPAQIILVVPPQFGAGDILGRGRWQRLSPTLPDQESDEAFDNKGSGCVAPLTRLGCRDEF